MRTQSETTGDLSSTPARIRESKEQHEANMIDLELDRCASRAYALRDGDERWREATRHIDAARRFVREMMHPRRREETR